MLGVGPASSIATPGSANKIAALCDSHARNLGGAHVLLIHRGTPIALHVIAACDYF
jgi:hypothetical protein